jgi:hypothetical protein
MNMDKNEKQFVEQEAPLKNTDKAFVQVNKDGSPLMPDLGNQKKQDQSEREEEVRKGTNEINP